MKTTRSANPRKPRAVRVVIAEDHVLLRELIVRAVSNTDRAFRFIAEVATLTAAIQGCVDLDPDLLILSLALMTREGRGAVARFRSQVRNINVLVYASSPVSEQDVALALRTGVNGCVGKNTGLAEFITAVERTRHGNNYFCMDTSRLLAEMAMGQHGKPDSPVLSPREIEVLQLIAAGKTSKQAARILGLSVATIDTHRRNLMVKTEAHNAADLIRYGHAHGLIQSGPAV